MSDVTTIKIKKIRQSCKTVEVCSENRNIIHKTGTRAIFLRGGLHPHLALIWSPDGKDPFWDKRSVTGFAYSFLNLRVDSLTHYDILRGVVHVFFGNVSTSVFPIVQMRWRWNRHEAQLLQLLLLYSSLQNWLSSHHWFKCIWFWYTNNW